MSIAIRSFAKINLGLKIGPARADGFHELRTIYQTLALHDVVRVEVQPGEGIEIRCSDPRVPLRRDQHLLQSRRAGAASAAKAAGKVVIDDREAVAGAGRHGRGVVERGRDDAWAWSARSTRSFPPQEKLRIAAEVGSDLPLFLIGGTVLGVDRGQEVYAAARPSADAPGGGDAAGRSFDAEGLCAVGRARGASRARGCIDRCRCSRRYNKTVRSGVCLPG